MNRPNIIWLSLESTRADHTTMGGYHRDTTPTLARLAASSDGVWFPHCVSHARWTPESTTSILTGTYPSTHRVGFPDGADPGQLSSDLLTVPDRLAEQGYRTAMVTGNSYTSSIGVAERFGTFDQPMREDLYSMAGVATAVEYFRDFDTYGTDEFDLAKVKRAVHPLLHMNVLKRRVKQFAQSDRPFFLYSHLNNIHSPYCPPPSFLEPYANELRMSADEAVRFAQHVNDTIWDQTEHGSQFTPDEWAALKATYDAEIAFADTLIESMISMLRGLTLGETIIVVTGDHGELFGERDLISHNLVLHDGLIHVPMVVYGLPTLADRANDPIGHIDVMQTLVDYAGANTDGMYGTNLLDEPSEYTISQRGPMREVLSKRVEATPTFDADRFHPGELSAIRTAAFKYQRSADGSELFRLPDETMDVSEEFSGVADELDSALTEQLTNLPSYNGADEAALTDAMEDQLRDLGYL